MVFVCPTTQQTREGVMGSEKPPHDYCDPKITSAVVEAYEAVWAVIQISEPVRDAKSEPGSLKAI